MCVCVCVCVCVWRTKVRMIGLNTDLQINKFSCTRIE